MEKVMLSATGTVLRKWLAVSMVCILCLFTAGRAVRAEGKGIIFGTISDAKNKTNLRDVAITIVETEQQVISDRSGRYQISLPPGSYELEFLYVGYKPEVKKVSIAAGEQTELNVVLGEYLVDMEKMVVTAKRTGEAKSINRQKNALNLKSVVSSDIFGRFPDQNAAEALNRLPGVSVERDQGEGRFVIIRGINPDLNSYAVDGVPMAAPDADDRAVLLDVVPSDTLEALEVTKSVLPDQPHDAIGGYVNIETPSAFDYEERVIRGEFQGNYSDLVEEWEGGFSLAFGDTFGPDNEFGFFISGNLDRRDMGSDNREADPLEIEERDDGAEFWVPTALEYREYDLERDRAGVTSQLEYRPNINNHYFLRGNWSEYEDFEIRRRSVIEPDDINTDTSVLTATSGQLLDTETAIELKDRTETLTNYAISFGGENILNRFTLDYKVGYSYAEEDTPDDMEVAYEAEDVTTYNYWNAVDYRPAVGFAAGVDPWNPANLEFDEVEDADQLVEEDNWAFIANVKMDVDNTEWLSSLKAGIWINLKDKDNDIEVWKSDDNPAEIDTMEAVVGSGRSEYSDLPLIDDDFEGYFRRNRDAFAMERDEFDSLAGDYETDEDIFAGYIMGNFKFGRVDAISGIRVEYTDFETTGYSIDEEAPEDALLTTVDNDYTDVLPSIHLRYPWSDNLIFRASLGNTIARPTFEQSRFAEEIDGEDITVGNPNLDSYEAMNLDLSCEYYFGAFGLLGVGLFYKDIDEFIFEQEIAGGSRLGGDLTTFNNGDDGDIFGVEFSYNQLLTFLPCPFDGFGIYANLTLTDSEMTVLPTGGGRKRDVDFLKQSDQIGNIALTYEKYGFFFRIAGTFRSDYLDTLGEMPSEDRYMDDHFQLDLSSSYTLKDKYTIFLNFVNLNNEPLRAYFDGSDRLSQYEKYGWSTMLGFKWRI